MYLKNLNFLAFGQAYLTMKATELLRGRFFPLCAYLFQIKHNQKTTNIRFWTSIKSQNLVQLRRVQYFICPQQY